MPGSPGGLGRGSDHPAIWKDGAVDAAINAEKFLIELGGIDLLSELANRGHRLIPLRFPAVSVVINGVDDGFGGFELGLKGGSGHGWLARGGGSGSPLPVPIM